MQLSRTDVCFANKLVIVVEFFTGIYWDDGFTSVFLLFLMHTYLQDFKSFEKHVKYVYIKSEIFPTELRLSECQKNKQATLCSLSLSVSLSVSLSLSLSEQHEHEIIEDVVEECLKENQQTMKGDMFL